MSDPNDENAREEGRARARSTAVWDARLCTKECWDYGMSTIPHDAVGADMTKHALYNSYGPKLWYRDEEFHCKDCGKREVWTAQQQQWWFEVAKGQINSRADRCRPCRRAWQEQSGKVSHATRQARKRGAVPDVLPE
jgi:hypothetical protein